MSETSSNRSYDNDSAQIDIDRLVNDVSSSSPSLSSRSSFLSSKYENALKRIDFVLVYRTQGSTINLEVPQDSEALRKVFEQNLVEDGLELRHLNSTVENDYSFVHIYANWEVLTRYAELMSLRMPMKTIKSNLKILFDEECNQESKAFTTTFSRDKEYLFDIPEHVPEEFFCPSQRAEIVDFILRRTRFNDANDVFSIGINRLLADSVYISAYPLHDEGIEQCSNKECKTKRCYLQRNWASLSCIFNKQPLNSVVEYFGVKISMYYAWVGFHTTMLVAPALMGLLCILFGALTMNKSELIQDVCHPLDDLLMCPTCAINCNYTRVSESCPETKASYIFGNVTTIAFAVFISVWATIYLEMWKRYSAQISHKWDLADFTTVDEYPRPEFLANLTRSKKTRLNPITHMVEPYIPFIFGRLPYFIISSSLVLLCIVIVLLIMISIIVYRVSIQIAFLARINHHPNNFPIIHKYGDNLITVTAAMINLCLILLLSHLYKNLAYFLTELERPRTQNEFDNSLTLKMFLFEFVNYYSSFFYIAFFKGRFQLQPPEGGLQPANQSYLIESCPLGGCYFDLMVQMVIIFLGKGLLRNIGEYVWPYVQSVYKRRRYLDSNGRTKTTKLQQWEEDFLLESWNHMSLFYEYLELVIQFGFVTIFVSAFPLAPLLALLNNIFEIRFDAKKMLRNFKRPVAQRAKDIGVWYSILDSIGKLSVFTNSMIIAFTTDIIPQLVYYFSNGYSMEGYFQSTVSYYRLTEQDPRVNVAECVFNAYRHRPGTEHAYHPTEQHWRMLIYRIVFVVVFQNSVQALNLLLKALIPDEPRQLRLQKRQHAYLTNELIIRHELTKKTSSTFLTTTRINRF